MLRGSWIGPSSQQAASNAGDDDKDGFSYSAGYIQVNDLGSDC